MVATAIDNGVLRRMLSTEGDELPPEVARFFLGLAFSEADHQRVHILSEKANEGDLNSQERDELSMYVLLGDFLTIMQSRSRMALKKQSPAL